MVNQLTPALRTCCSTRTIPSSTGGSGATTPSRRLDGRDVPVLLSVGYAACHWCHVMAHESFSDPGVAAVMNEKLGVREGKSTGGSDRAVSTPNMYMQATLAMTGSGRLADDVLPDAGQPTILLRHLLPRNPGGARAAEFHPARRGRWQCCDLAGAAAKIGRTWSDAHDRGSFVGRR